MEACNRYYTREFDKPRLSLAATKLATCSGTEEAGLAGTAR